MARNGVIRIGTTAILKTEDGLETFLIKHDGESNPSEGAISSKSPLGRALIGRRPGETVEVTVPRGRRYSVKILSLLS